MTEGPDTTVKLLLWRGEESNRKQSNKGKTRGGRKQTHDGLASIKNAHEFALCTQETDSKPQAG